MTLTTSSTDMGDLSHIIPILHVNSTKLFINQLMCSRGCITLVCPAVKEPVIFFRERVRKTCNTVKDTV